MEKSEQLEPYQPQHHRCLQQQLTLSSGAALRMPQSIYFIGYAIGVNIRIGGFNFEVHNDVSGSFRLKDLLWS